MQLPLGASRACATLSRDHAVTQINPTLEARLTAEAVRHLEQNGDTLDGSEQVEAAMAGHGGSVEQRIIERARQLGVEAGIGPSLRRVQSYARTLGYIALALALVLGSLAALQAFDQGRSVVNFYWLLLVLLGFNLASLAFWLLGLWASNSAAAGVLGKSGAYLVQRWITKTATPGSNDITLTKAWLSVMLNGAPGRWALSSLGHGLWAAYLIGGLLMILVLLSARQYDFVWETTLLGADTFIPLTQALAVLPAQLGLATPSLEQITQSRLGGDPLLLASARQAWASLLIASLLLYGVLPRLLLFALCRMLQSRALAKFQLDTSRPYYVRLRQRLIPPARALGIVDADDEAADTSRSKPISDHSTSMPADAYWLGIELDPEQAWPPQPLPPQRDLGLISSRDEQHRALIRVAELSRSPLVLVAPLQRSPDRGLARFISQLLSAHPRDCWLALLENPGSAGTSEQERDARLVDWYALAAQSGIEADNIAQLLAPIPDDDRNSSHG